jgi:ABC-type sugar transport system ATPase subunit
MESPKMNELFKNNFRMMLVGPSECGKTEILY